MNPIESEKRLLPASNRELIFGLICLAVGAFYANCLLFGGFRLGFGIASCMSLLAAWGYLRLCGCRGGWYTNALLVLSLIIAAGFGWSADGFVKIVMLIFLLIAGNLSLTLQAGRNRHAPGFARTVLDAPRTIFLRGMGQMGQAREGIVTAFRSGGKLTQSTAAILTGLAIAIPALLIVVPLLISSDAAFEGLVDLLPDFDLTECIFTCIWGALAAWYFYTRAVSLHHGEEPKWESRPRKGFHPLTMNTALGAVCFVYLAYLFSQLAYFVGGFSGILPEGFTAAEYARRGFFEMTCLCGVNLGLMTFGVSCVRREGRAPLATRLLCLFIGLTTLFLAAASWAKMALYIDRYGLTRLRVLTLVITLFLALTTALVCLWLFLPKLKYMQAVLLSGLVMGAAVLWLDVDTQVARYNVDHYLSGDLSAVDLDYLTDLGPGAVPYLQKLTLCDDPDLRSRATAALRLMWIDDADDFRELTYVNQRAADILDQYHPREQAEIIDIP